MPSNWREDDSIPEKVDQAIHKRAVSASRGDYEREIPIIINTPDDLEHLKAKVEWMPLILDDPRVIDRVEPFIEVKTGGLNDTVTVKGVNWGWLNYGEGSLNLEVDSGRHPVPVGRRFMAGEPVARYYLKFNNVGEVSWMNPFKARWFKPEHRGPNYEVDSREISLEGLSDGVQCRFEWRRYGEDSSRNKKPPNYNWDVYCDWSSPEDWTDRNPDRSANVYQHQQEDYGPLKRDIPRDLRVNAVAKDFNRFRRCNVETP